MALKDWKKMQTTGDIPSWSGKHNRQLWIVKSISDDWKREYKVRSDFDKPVMTTFKTKSEALAYAKSYMKKH